MPKKSNLSDLLNQLDDAVALVEERAAALTDATTAQASTRERAQKAFDAAIAKANETQQSASTAYAEAVAALNELQTEVGGRLGNLTNARVRESR